MENTEFEDFKVKFDSKLKKLLDGTYELNNFLEFGLRRRLSAEAEKICSSRLSYEGFIFFELILNILIKFYMKY